MLTEFIYTSNTKLIVNVSMLVPQYLVSWYQGATHWGVWTKDAQHLSYRGFFDLEVIQQF